MMEQMTITLRTKSPVVLSAPGNTNLLTSTRDVFAGSVLRGLVAAQYIPRRRPASLSHCPPPCKRARTAA